MFHRTYERNSNVENTTNSKSQKLLSSWKGLGKREREISEVVSAATVKLISRRAKINYDVFSG